MSSLENKMIHSSEETTNKEIRSMDQAECIWKKFKSGFWVLFWVHVFLSGASRSTQDKDAAIFFSILGLLPILIMVWHIAWHSYLFSKKKISFLKGLLGFWWAGLVGIFLSYFAVQLDYYKATGKKFAPREKFVAISLLVISVLFAISLGDSISSVFYLSTTATQQNNQNSDSNEWVRVVSANQKFSVDLPKQWELLADEKKDGKIEAVVYQAEELEGAIVYIVKYENYESLFKKEGIDSFNEVQEQNFLKDLVDNQVNELDLSNFSTQFLKVKGFNSIKYKGLLTENSKSTNIEGVMILANKASYSIVVMDEQGFGHNLNRILDSLLIEK